MRKWLKHVIICTENLKLRGLNAHLEVGLEASQQGLGLDFFLLLRRHVFKLFIQNSRINSEVN
jgi:hypothetical protein